MNQQCKVCGEPAAGFHFGAFTCEGCKSFFGRTYNNLGSISECKNGGVCVINKKNRTACKACRLRKCLLVGMSKSGSRYGRRSNWFRIRCLLQEQSGNNNNNPCPGNPLGSPFGAGFLPSFMPGLQTQAQQNLVNYVQPLAGKDVRDMQSPNQEDLALQAHLLQVAMIKQQQAQQEQQHRQQQQHQHQPSRRRDQSPRPDSDCYGQRQELRLRGWSSSKESASGDEEPQPRVQKGQQCLARAQQALRQAQARTASPERSASSPAPRRRPDYPFPYQQIVRSAEEFLAAGAASGSVEGVFRPYMPIYNRSATSPSDSGASSVETDEHDESRGNSTNSFQKGASSSPPPHLPGEPFPQRRVSASVTITPDFQARRRAHHDRPAPHNQAYPPRELVTPATGQHAMRGGDLILASPSPGGLAVEQLEPIDLSLKSAAGRPEPNQTQAQDAPAENSSSNSDSDSSELPSKPEDPELAQTKSSNPLDLSVESKRPKSELPS